VIGERAILLSELRECAEPGLIQIYQSVPPGAQRNAAISQLYRAVLERLVDEELQRRAAQQSRLTVSAREVDEALERVAAQNAITVDKLLTEAKNSGLSERAYRDELRRQLLEAKLINVRLQGRIRVTDEDIRSAYRKLVLEERSQLSFTPAWIVLEAGTGPEEQRAQRELAERIAAQAKAGDFGALAREHSTDGSSRAAGGRLSPMRPTQLPPAPAPRAGRDVAAHPFGQPPHRAQGARAGGVAAPRLRRGAPRAGRARVPREDGASEEDVARRPAPAALRRNPALTPRTSSPRSELPNWQSCPCPPTGWRTRAPRPCQRHPRSGRRCTWHAPCSKTRARRSRGPFEAREVRDR